MREKKITKKNENKNECSNGWKKFYGTACARGASFPVKIPNEIFSSKKYVKMSHYCVNNDTTNSKIS